MSGSIQDQIISIAKSEIGYHEGRSGGHWNNREKYAGALPGMKWVDTQGQPWCDVFVHWVFQQAGVLALLPDVTPGSPGGSASCDVSRAAWRKVGRYSEYPAIGAQVFYGVPTDSNHTGIVVDYDDTYIWAVEGNTNSTGAREGDGVYLKKRLRRSANVLGYGYPAYPGGIKSADPDWITGFPQGQSGLVVVGADASHYQNLTLAGLRTAKNAGLRWLSLKATQGMDYVDPKYARYRAYARQAGITPGAYHFAETVGSPVSQAHHFLDVAKPMEGDFRSMLDVEPGGGFAKWSRGQRTDFVGKWVDVVRAEIGVRPIIYTSLDLDDSFDCMLWVARYHPQNAAPAIPKPWKGYRIRQFSNGEVGVPSMFPGLPVPTDLNTMKEGLTGDLNWFRIPAKDEPVPPPPPPPVPSPGRSTVLKLLGIDMLDHLTSDHDGVVWNFQMSSGEKFSTFHWNVQGTDPDVSTSALVEKALTAGSMGAFNEIEHASLQQYILSLAAKGWKSYLPGVKLSDDGLTVVKGSSKSYNVVVWDASVWDFVAADDKVVFGGVLHITPARVVNRVWLRHQVSGEVVCRLIGHNVHHIEVGGNARTNGNLPGQIGRAQTYIKALADSTVEAAALPVGDEQVSAPVVGSCDTNVDYNADKRQVLAGKGTGWFPYTVLGPVASIKNMNNHPPTHGSRLIDWGWYRQAH